MYGIVHDFTSGLAKHLLASIFDILHLVFCDLFLFHISILLFQDLIRCLVLANRHLVGLVLLLLRFFITLLIVRLDGLALDLQILS